jgi:hypothetical protein
MIGGAIGVDPRRWKGTLTASSWPRKQHVACPPTAPVCSYGYCETQ